MKGLLVKTSSALMVLSVIAGSSVCSLAASAHSGRTEIRYNLELKRNGKTRMVTNDMNFLPGDRLRIHISSNVGGQAKVTVLPRNREPGIKLFPCPGEGENTIYANEQLVLPAHGKEGWLRFGMISGTDRVRVSFTPSEQTDESEVDASAVQAINFDILLKHENSNSVAVLPQ